jgi:hypothetical protein
MRKAYQATEPHEHLGGGEPPEVAHLRGQGDGSDMFCELPIEMHAKSYAYSYHCPGETDPVFVTMIMYLKTAVT